MAKEKVSIREKAENEMGSLVEQHNELVQNLQEMNARLSEVKQMIVEKQGYLKALDDCDKECKEK